MEEILPRVSLRLLLRLVASFTALGFPVKPGWATLEARPEQRADCTIAFASLAPWDLTVRPDGSELRQLTRSPGLDMHPVWSPDGKWICFASARGGFKDEHPLTGNPQPCGDLYLMRPGGSEARALTDNQFEDGTPGWAPLPNLPTER